MYSALEWLLGAGIVTVLLTQIITIARSVIGSLITRSRARKGLLRLLYTEVAQNKVNADYVAPLLDQPDTAKGVLAMRGRYVSAEAWKASRVDLAQNVSSKHFAVLSDYYKNVLLLDEVVTVERAKKDREAAYETSSDTIQKAKLLLQALSERESEVEALIRAQVPDVTAGDKYAELVQKQELLNPPNSKSYNARFPGI